jgi:hypothetical protein
MVRFIRSGSVLTNLAQAMDMLVPEDRDLPDRQTQSDKVPYKSETINESELEMS